MAWSDSVEALARSRELLAIPVYDPLAPKAKADPKEGA